MTDPTPTAVVVATLPVSDLLRSVAWYQRLGFTALSVWEADDYAILEFRGSELHLAANVEITGTPSWSGCYLRVHDVDDLHARWVALGAKDLTGLTDQPYGIREFATEDPDHNLWRVGTPIAHPASSGPTASAAWTGDAAATSGSAGTSDPSWLDVVTDSECADCGFTIADANHAGLAGRIVDESHQLGAALTAADDERVRTRPHAETWSPLEYGAHVRDTLAVFTERIVRTRREDHPELGWWDHEAALEGSYANELEADAVADDINRNASHLATALRDMADDDWDRPATRDGDPFTVDLLARYLLHEVRHHRVDVQRELSDG